MTPTLRKVALTAHVTFSVGWLGAVVAYLALAIAGLASRDAQTVRAAYPSLELLIRFVIVPLALASLASGLFQSLATPWGLIRHYWIVAKLALTVVATTILLIHMPAVGRMARIAAETALSADDFRTERLQLVIHAAGGLGVLLVITTLSVFKPWGLTPYGRRARSERPPAVVEAPVLVAAQEAATPRWAKIVGVHVVLVLVLVAVAHHIASGGHHH
ncbi:MAG: hypothetical protein ACAI25_16490 [Planctomycetota bacterium]